MNKTALIAVIGVLVLIIAYLLYSNWHLTTTNKQLIQATLPTASPIPPKQLSVKLNAVGTSAESGTALLKEVNGSVMIDLILQNASKNTPQPVHLNKGTCSELGLIKYPLSNVINSRSETILSLSMAQLGQNLPLAISVYKAANQPDSYAACGDIKF